MTTTKNPLHMIPLFIVLWAARASAVHSEPIDLAAVPAGKGWKLDNCTATMVEVKGKRALRLDAPHAGLAWLEGSSFGSGVVEFDSLGASQPFQSNFLGFAFRVVDAKTHDVVYFRPFNFRSEDPVHHSHAVQYVSEPKWSWPRLREERTGQFEKPILPEPDGDAWFHVRIVVEAPKVSVFVNGAKEPSLVVDELSDRAAGMFGLFAEGLPCHFANLTVTPKK